MTKKILWFFTIVFIAVGGMALAVYGQQFVHYIQNSQATDPVQTDGNGNPNAQFSRESLPRVDATELTQPAMEPLFQDSVSLPSLAGEASNFAEQSPSVPVLAPTAAVNDHLLTLFTSIMTDLRSETDSRRKEELRAKLREILKSQIEKDIATNEAQLAAIEDRTKALRTELERRKENQVQVLNTLMLVVENPSAGMGVSNEWMRAILESPSPLMPQSAVYTPNDQNSFAPAVQSTRLGTAAAMQDSFAPDLRNSMPESVPAHQDSFAPAVQSSERRGATLMSNNSVEYSYPVEAQELLSPISRNLPNEPNEDLRVDAARLKNSHILPFRLELERLKSTLGNDHPDVRTLTKAIEVYEKLLNDSTKESPDQSSAGLDSNLPEPEDVLDPVDSTKPLEFDRPMNKPEAAAEGAEVEAAESEPLEPIITDEPSSV